MRAKRLAALIRKEAIQTLRDRRTLTIILVLPLLELFLFAYAIRLTVDHLPMAVADMSRDAQSRAFVTALVNSKYFDVATYVESQAEVVQAIDEGRAKVGVMIPPDFAVQVERGDAQVLILLDGSDSFSVNSGYSAAVAVAQARALNLAAERARRQGIELKTAPITTSTRVLYNPNLNDLIFIMPGLIGLLLQMMAVLTTAQSVVREYELGTIEQLLVTPARPLELIVGKLVPNVALMLTILVNTILAGVFWFGVPFQGNPWLFAGLAFLFVWSGLGLGLLVSAIARTQKEAQQLSVVLSLFGMLLTGFIYPRGPMPAAVRWVGNLLPLTYFIRIARGIITKGVGLTFLWTDVAALAVYSVLILGFAALTTRRRLD
ncbi:MAG: ABC transporter permease [Chloroflexi bacterium]|nr:ABC transporter permease [Chloroflexota bacterium]